jgi:large subunit ribosomal protein L25
MEFVKLAATMRQATGKGPARRMRAEGRVPAVIYGKDMATISIAIDPKEIVQALSGPLRTNTVLTIGLVGDTEGMPEEIHAIVRSHQYHPVMRNLIHVDFVRIDEKKLITVEVPIVTIGRSVGELSGGTLTMIYRSLPVECLPSAIPTHLEIEVSHLEIGSMVTVGELDLPEDVTSIIPAGNPLISVIAPKVEEEPEEVTEGEEGAEGAEGEETAEGEEKKPEDGEKKKYEGGEKKKYEGGEKKGKD